MLYIYIGLQLVTSQTSYGQYLSNYIYFNVQILLNHFLITLITLLVLFLASFLLRTNVYSYKTIRIFIYLSLYMLFVFFLAFENWKSKLLFRYLHYWSKHPLYLHRHLHYSLWIFTTHYKDFTILLFIHLHAIIS